MKLKFSSNPGAHERHLIRRHSNQLFHNHLFDGYDLQVAREKDVTEISQFEQDLQDTLNSCLNLNKNAETEEVLNLKDQLDLLHERSCGLGGNFEKERQAINAVLTPIMYSVERAAAGDPIAIEKLTEEKEARKMHFELLQNTIVCDLLRPDSPIEQSELAATLLGEERETLEIVLCLFDPEQLKRLALQCRELLENSSLEDNHSAWVNLTTIDGYNIHPVH